MGQTPIPDLVTIQTVTGNWMPEVRRMDATLVHAARLYDELDKRESALFRKDRPVRNRRLAVMVHNSHALGIERFASDQGAERAGLRFWRTVKHGKIRLFYTPMALELATHGEVGALRTREHHHAARVAVKAVHHTWTLFAPNARNIRKIPQQKIAKRSIRISWSPMHNQPGGLVYDNYGIIGMKHFYRYVRPAFHLLLWYRKQWQ